jgi:oxygen-independent coproporphyrinogen III oxidase
MAGIYIHIPYCRQKCSYCNFFSVVSRKSVPEMIAAICREMELRASKDQKQPGAIKVEDQPAFRQIIDNELASTKQPIETLYLGGGTPSLLEKHLLEKLFNTVFHNFDIAKDAEITLEANPDDITVENLDFWREIGINRLSIGIQSFRDDDLEYLNRVHSAEKALGCIHLARQHGFPDLTIDLIYGVPTLSNQQWIENLEVFAGLSIPHLSAYALTVEPRTPLSNLIEKGKVKPVDEKQASEQFEILMQFMHKHNYLHYEISNFCLPGHFARHNLSYWKGTTYLGFGPSAHSFNGSARQWNVSSVNEYLAAIKNDVIPAEHEELSLTNRYNEYVMTGLRTMWGCDTGEISNQFGLEYERYFIEQSMKWIDQSFMERSGNQFILTNQGKLLADGIASDLFYI